MTREQFIAKAVREHEKRLGIPPGWWGDYHHVVGPERVEVVFRRSGTWHVIYCGKLVSKHDSREFAIRKARRLP